MKHSNVAFFIPHEGCPHQCSFCNQKTITGVSERVTGEQVYKTLSQAQKALQGREHCSEIAFFGGSFTAVPKDYREELLKAAYPFVKEKSFSGIRVSTRPDAVDDEVLSQLKRYGVTAVELGAQSMSDRVLTCNQRGHTSRDVETASVKIKEWGFSLGLQMMTGLYGSSDEDDIQTANQLISLRPDCVRIYPTVVMKGTYLEELFRKGQYVPKNAEQSIALCARLLRMFEKNQIPVIRLGLHDTPQLKENFVAGAYHPAFRERCQSYLFYEMILSFVRKFETAPRNLTVFGNPADLSKIIGQKRENIEKLNNLGIQAKVMGKLSVPTGQIHIECR